MGRYSTQESLYDTSAWPAATARPYPGESRPLERVPDLHRPAPRDEAPAVPSAVLPRRPYEERVVAHEECGETDTTLAQLDADARTLPADSLAANNRARDALGIPRAQLATARRTVRRTRTVTVDRNLAARLARLTRRDLQQLVDEVAADAFRRTFGES